MPTVSDAAPRVSAEDRSARAATRHVGGRWAVLAGRALRDARVRTLAFGCLFGFIAYLQALTYREAYATRASRLHFAHSFGANRALALFYGKAYDLLSVGGYSAWRVGGTLAIFSAVFGLLAAVRAFRAEEDAGRLELVLAAPVSRGTNYLAALAAIGASLSILWLAEFGGLVLARLPLVSSAYLALATASVASVCAGIGAVVSQIAPTRRTALELGAIAAAAALGLRVVADTVSGAGLARWLTPLGWAELMRPFTGARPVVLALPVLATAALLAVAGAMARRRDLGAGILQVADTAAPHLRLLTPSIALALRLERGGLFAWAGMGAAFAAVCGAISKADQSAGLSTSAQRELDKLGGGSVVSAAGYLGLTFIFFVFALSLFAVAQIGAASHEESAGRLQMLLALPLGRARWLGGRLALATGAIASVSLVCGLMGWAAAEVGGASVSLPGMLGAAANCVAMGVLFLGITALAYASVPRVASGVGYAVATVAFLWQLIGSLLSVPHWMRALTPFAHIGLAPGSAFRLVPVLVLIGIGAAAAVGGVAGFRRRDLLGA